MTVVKRVEIEGLAGRPGAIDLDFNDDINIIYGLNGSGKTTLLRLLFSALQDDVSHIRRVPFVNAKVSFLTDDSNELVTRTITSKQVEIIPVQAPTIIPTANGPITIPFQGPHRGWQSEVQVAQPVPSSYLSVSRLFGDPNLHFWASGPEGSPYSESRLEQQFLQLAFNRWINYSNTLLSDIRKYQDDVMTAVLNSLFTQNTAKKKRKAEPEVAYDSVRHFFERRSIKLDASQTNFLDMYANDERLQSVVRDIQEVEKQIVAAEHPRRQLEELINRFVSNNKRILFTEHGISVEVGNQILTIDLLSSGEKHLIRILLECLVALGDCIIVDEPELSLHIDWQYELVNAMRTVNPKMQVIMATHSPAILANLPHSKTFDLD